jgi:Predicted nucleic acid-binding protein, contains PIN domain
MKLILLDAGPTLAWLDANDPYHSAVREKMGELTGKLVTTGAVITEVVFFIQEAREGASRLTDWLRRMRVDIVNCFDPESLQSAALLMDRYADAPMDYADATLVACADELNCGDILTLDIRGFRTYRYQHNKRFNLLLQDG